MLTQTITSMVTSQKWRVPIKSTRVARMQVTTIRVSLKSPSNIRETPATASRQSERLRHSSTDIIESVSQAS